MFPIIRNRGSHRVAQKIILTLLLAACWLYAETSESDIIHSDELILSPQCKSGTDSSSKENKACSPQSAPEKQKHLTEIYEKLDALNEAIGKYDSGELTDRLKVLREEFQTDYSNRDAQSDNKESQGNSLFADGVTGLSETDFWSLGSVWREVEVVIDNNGTVASCDALDQNVAKEAAKPGTDKIIYLTFDDGPLLGTNNVLEVLEEENVDATMFFVGKHILRKRHTFKKASEMSNILVANHTYSHANGRYTRFYNNGEKLVKDIDKTQDLIGGAKYQRLAGRNVWRVPGVFRNDYGLRKKRREREASCYNCVAREGYFIYGWDIEWRFSHKTGRPLWNAKKMARKIDRCYRKGRVAQKGKLVLLAHDFMFRSRFGGKRELRKLIALLRKSGWKFETIKSYSPYYPHYYVRKHNSTGSKLAMATVSEPLPKAKTHRSHRKKRKRKRKSRRSLVSSRAHSHLDLF